MRALNRGAYQNLTDHDRPVTLSARRSLALLQNNKHIKHSLTIFEQCIDVSISWGVGGARLQTVETH